jgi:hypothetical protein
MMAASDLVRVARDPALALEVEARLLGEQLAYQGALRGVVDGVHAVEPVGDPAGAGLEHHHLEAGKLAEDPVLEERREGVSHGIGCRHVQEERVPHARVLAEAAGPGPLGLEARMDAEGQAELLGGREDPLVVTMTERALF